MTTEVSSTPAESILPVSAGPFPLRPACPCPPAAPPPAPLHPHPPITPLTHPPRPTLPTCPAHPPYPRQDAYRDPVKLPCSHLFCADCLGEWVERERTCPMCRAAVGPAAAKKVGSYSDGRTPLCPYVF